MTNKPKLGQNSAKINQIAGDLHLVQLRVLNKYFIQIGCNFENLPISGFKNHLQTKYNLHISIFQTPFTFVSSL